ncbi:BTB/POZ domain-containing protein At5g66560-like isoform X2 [Cynara cardunculus var. scolymus]|uniref:BTB/POZ domain-containing protein At5g66560-like isoform X2 n=1 Tax=Cynara cardunculus var. scolymus TaxID=59895 RepID=UPI000D62D019|nr:BTB/POZ domain-containing protein At5g66560-like isoform X2 [Cynara cardunculus var. scolymus]
MSFHLHKFPLMARSKKLHEVITEHETNPTGRTAADSDDFCHVTLPDFPGGSETFETAAKFCYAVKIELSSSNVAPLRCAGEVLEMTEEYCEDNLISKAERFLSQTVLRSLRDSIRTLKSCEDLLPMAESLGIVQRCIDSIVSKASASDPSLFGWPVNEFTNSGAAAVSSSHETGSRRKGATASGGDRWFDELVFLSPPLFKRLIVSIKARDLNPEIVENCLISYAKKHIPGVNRGGRRSSSSSVLSEIEQKELLETIVTNLPEENGLRSSPAVTVFFGMLRAANILIASNACRATLEKKIGLQLEQATLDDLLIPSYSYLTETLYDVDCVQRILAHFLRSNRVRSVTLMLVGKLIDGYLSEIASDTNLKTDKFLDLAFALPEQSRLYDDGLYRSVDVYLKAHPWIKEADRERICGVMDCRKLTLEACTHAAQNERLPLRAVVQVLFFEQLQLRQAIAGTLINTDIGRLDMERLPEMARQEDESIVEDEVERGIGGTWTAAVRDNQVLRLDMDSMRTRVNHLERECSTMKKAIEKIHKMGPSGWRGSLTKKLGCKFKTQVCDSHEPTIVEARKGRTHRHHHQQ